MFKSTAIILLSLVALHDCVPSIGSDPVPPRPTPIPADTDKCQAAEDHLTQMCNANKETNGYCCAVVAPTKKGKSFTQFCQDKQNTGIALNPKCLSEIKSCGEIDSCTGSK
jgi:hypothetical protein